MKFGIPGISIMILTAGLVLPPAARPGIWLCGGISLPVHSAFVDRGEVVNSRGVLQPEAWISAFGFEMAVWGNIDLTDHDGRRGEFTEVELELAYWRELGSFEAGLGYEYSHHPFESDENSQEIFFGVCWGEPVTLSLKANYDFDLIKGWYLRGCLSCCRKVGIFRLTPTASIGWGSKNFNQHLFETAKNALVDLELELKASVPLGEGFSLFSRAAFFTLLDGDLRAEAGGDRDGFLAGGGLAFEF